MCGRYTIAVAADELLAEFGVEPPPSFEPRYNVAPQQLVPVIGMGPSDRQRMAMVRWGLVPNWVKSPKDVRHTINARAETLLDRPAFREPFLNRRCLVIADGFYEWKRDGSGKIPYRIHMRSGRPFAFAGLWDAWLDDEGVPEFSCAIVTTRASAAIEAIHERMPVILDAAARSAWIDPAAHVDALQQLLHPYAGDIEAYPVTSLVNSVANDSPSCIEAVAE